MKKVGDDVWFVQGDERIYGSIIAIEGTFAKVLLNSDIPVMRTRCIPLDNLYIMPRKAREEKTRHQRGLVSGRKEGGTSKDAEHYKKAAMQPIEVMQRFLTHEEFLGFLKGNIIKYKARAIYKGKQAEDMQKARQYAYWLAMAEAGVVIRAEHDSVPSGFIMNTTFDIKHNFSDARLIRGGIE